MLHDAVVAWRDAVIVMTSDSALTPGCFTSRNDYGQVVHTPAYFFTQCDLVPDKGRRRPATAQIK